MTFKQYILTGLSPEQQDREMSKMIFSIKEDVNFPDTANIKQMAEYLYRELDQDATLAFQKLLMFWKYAQNGYKEPKDMGILAEINHIIVLQTNDRSYAWAHQIPAHINHRN